MKFNIINKIILVAGMALMFTACIKDDVDDTTTQGSTFVKLLESPQNAIFFEPFTEIRTVELFSLRKDANSGAELNTPLTVKLTPNPTLITNYNATNSTDYEKLPDSLYTLDAGNPFASGIYQMSLGAGEFAKEFTIKLNGAKWNLSKKYALGFTINDAGGKPVTDGKKDVLVLISIKNKWDGIYVVSGTMTDLVNPNLTGIYDDPGGYGVDVEYSLQTVSATQCVVVSETYQGVPCVPIWDIGAQNWSLYGSFGLIVTFDPATDKIASVTNYYGQMSGGNKRSAELDPTGVNAYDEASKTVKIIYLMKQFANLNPPPPNNIRSVINEEWKYVRPR